MLGDSWEILQASSQLYRYALANNSCYVCLRYARMCLFMNLKQRNFYENNMQSKKEEEDIWDNSLKMQVNDCAHMFRVLKTCRNKTFFLSYSRLWEMRLKTFYEMVKLYCQQTSLKYRLHMCNDNFNSMILKHKRIFRKEMLLYEN